MEMRYEDILVKEYLAKGGVINYIAPRKKDPVFFPRNKGSVALVGRKAVSINRLRNPKC